MHAEVFLWTYPFTYFGKCLGVEGLGPIYKVLENSNMFAEQTCESLYSPTNNEAVLLWNHTARFIVVSHCGLSFFLRFYLFLETGEGREKDKERNISVWLPLACPLLQTWPATQACALTGNRTHDSLIRRPTLNPLSYTSQGSLYSYILFFFFF